jgi:hypothetical protein
MLCVTLFLLTLLYRLLTIPHPKHHPPWTLSVPSYVCAALPAAVSAVGRGFGLDLTFVALEDCGDSAETGLAVAL